jgi:hypothetical protein
MLEGLKEQARLRGAKRRRACKSDVPVMSDRTCAPHAVDLPRDDGSKRRAFRCPTCQVAVFSEYRRHEVRFVRGGTLDQPSEVTPDVHVFTRSKLSWITLPNSVPAFEVYYDSRTLWPAATLERLDAILSPADSGQAASRSTGR